jgi:general secretion pathway protein J
MRNAECGLQIKRTKIRNPKSEIRNRDGFTLIEVLLAMTILAIILTAVYASFSTAGRNIEHAEVSRDETDLARMLISRLSDDIANAHYYNTSLVAPLIFYGKREDDPTGEGKIMRDSLYLTTLTNWRRPGSKQTDLWEVGYFFKEKPESTGYVLMRWEKRELSKDVPALEGGNEFELTDQVLSLRFRYYDGSKWVEEWDSRKSHLLPNAVEIALMLASGKVYVTQVDRGR